MLSKSVFNALNSELTRERFAEDAYMAMAGVFQSNNLLGFTAWGKKNSHEEAKHMEGFFDYICDRDNVPVFEALEAFTPNTAQDPQDVLGTTLALLNQALELEKTVTEAIKQIYAQAESEEDDATLVFLHPYLTEQVDSEHDLTTMIGYLKSTGVVGLVAKNEKLEKG